MFDRWIPIPQSFHSLYHGGLFSKCVDCERDLLADDCWYGIERIFRGAEPIVEMAICMDCRQKISQELSRESTLRINAYFEERLDLDARYAMTQQWADHEISRWLDHCALLKIPASECRDFQIAAICRGPRLNLALLPIMISGVASREMQKLMSQKTRDRLGEMVQDFFGMPSEFADGPESYSPMIW